MAAFTLFQVGSDMPEFIVAQTKHEALEEHISRVGDNHYSDQEVEELADEISVVDLNKIGSFEQEDGSYKEMTFGDFLGADFKYSVPQIVCWNE